MRQELPGWGGCETRVTWVKERVRQELLGGEGVRQELPGWERG